MRWVFIGSGVAALVLLTLLRLFDPSALESLRNGYFDQLQRVHPRAAPDDVPIRIVDIDETTLASQGQWPWPRDKLARLVDRISARDPAVIVFDMIFPEPDRHAPVGRAGDTESPDHSGTQRDATDQLVDNDQRFADAIRGRPVVLGVAENPTGATAPHRPKAGFVELGNAPLLGLPAISGLTGNLPGLTAATAGLGSINMSPQDTSDIVRRVPLAWRYDDQLFPSLALEAIRVAAREDSILLRGEARTPGKPTALRVGEMDIPVMADGSFLIHYRPDDPGFYISAEKFLDEASQVPRQEIEGHVVLIGTSASGLLDIRATALAQNVPGVSIHAQIIEQILSGRFVTRGDHLQGLEIAGFVIAGILLLLVMSLSGAALSMLFGGGLAAGMTFSSWYLFVNHGVLVDISFPIGGGFLFFSGMTVLQFTVADREKRMLRRSFSHYVAPEVLERIEQAGHRVELGGELRDVTVMFCDIRNFTSLSEKLGATEMVALLNTTFNALSDEILKRNGTIDKYIGDSIMAFWNAPLDVDGHETQACGAALGMRRALLALNEHLDATIGDTIEIAIGIASGPACVGNIGSQNRFNYSAIGAVVNQASRIEGACRHVGYDILVSGSTANGAAGLALLPAGHLDLRGVSEHVTSYILVGDEQLAASASFHDLREKHAALTAELGAAGTCHGTSLQEPERIAEQVESGLKPFYARIMKRRSDFSVRGDGSQEGEGR